MKHSTSGVSDLEGVIRRGHNRGWALFLRFSMNSLNLDITCESLSTTVNIAMIQNFDS